MDFEYSLTHRVAESKSPLRERVRQVKVDADSTNDLIRSRNPLVASRPGEEPASGETVPLVVARLTCAPFPNMEMPENLQKSIKRYVFDTSARRKRDVWVETVRMIPL